MGRHGIENGIVSRRCAMALMASAVNRLHAAAPQPLRLGLSETLVMDLNVNDARAALLVWINRISTERDLPVDYKPNVFDTSLDLLKRIRTSQVDAVAINILEYRQVADHLDSSEVLIQEDGAKRQYVLLVKSSGNARKLADLRGRKLIVQRSPIMCIAAEWVNALLGADHLELKESFFGSMATEIKPVKVMLPVFFGQADACVTTRGAFETMAELNPQVLRELRPLATSAELAPISYMFRRNYRDPNRQLWVSALSDLNSSVTGRQLLTMFQADGLVVRGSECLSSALAILEQSDRFRRAATIRGNN
jgi:hypothetical protein